MNTAGILFIIIFLFGITTAFILIYKKRKSYSQKDETNFPFAGGSFLYNAGDVPAHHSQDTADDPDSSFDSGGGGDAGE